MRLLRGIFRPISIIVVVSAFLLATACIKALPPSNPSQRSNRVIRDEIVGPKSTSLEDVKQWMDNRVRRTGNSIYDRFQLSALDHSDPYTLRGDVIVHWPVDPKNPDDERLPIVDIVCAPLRHTGDNINTIDTAHDVVIRAKYSHRLNTEYIMMHFDRTGFKYGVSRIGLELYIPGQPAYVDFEYRVKVEPSKKSGWNPVGAAAGAMLRALGKVVGIGRGPAKMNAETQTEPAVANEAAGGAVRRLRV
ncbi:hypothetical protein HK102_007492 [Quaeritorhiza haematococci]|nr:hypothetical protein HK102_007492 [Quaeritorhiza haematococci]